jgi:predicted RNase H-like HicB family nuclease
MNILASLGQIGFGLPAVFGSIVRSLEAVAEALDFPGAVTQGSDCEDARLMIASALEDLAQILLEEGKALPVPSDDAQNPEPDLIELVPLSIHEGTAPK